MTSIHNRLIIYLKSLHYYQDETTVFSINGTQKRVTAFQNETLSLFKSRIITDHIPPQSAFFRRKLALHSDSQIRLVVGHALLNL